MFADRKLRKTLLKSLPIETGRLVIRYLQSGDVNDMYEYASTDEVCRYLLWSPHINRESTAGYIEYLQTRYTKGLYADWAVVLKSENKMIGTCGYASVKTDERSCEIGYVLSQNYRKQGYMTEAVEAILALSFETLGLEKAELRIIKENTDSRRFAERIGFLLDRISENELEIKGKYCDIAHYYMTAERYFEIKK